MIENLCDYSAINQTTPMDFHCKAIYSCARLPSRWFIVISKFIIFKIQKAILYRLHMIKSFTQLEGEKCRLY